MEEILARILHELKCEDLMQRLERLPNSDLNSLMMAVHSMQAGRATPAGLLRAQEDSRFARPSPIDPVLYHRLEADLLEIAREHGIAPKLLAPLAPIGSNAVYGFLDQKRVLSAGRGLEVMADPTNALALLMALERRAAAPDIIHRLCATARVTRVQPPSGRHSFAHFGLFSLVSGGRDSGHFQCEAKLLEEQLAYYAGVGERLLGGGLRLVLRKRLGYPDGFLPAMCDVLERFQARGNTVEEGPDDHGAYYLGLSFKLYARYQGDWLELGDGGFVDWTQRLLNNRKERCLISGVGLERLLMLSGERGGQMVTL